MLDRGIAHAVVPCAARSTRAIGEFDKGPVEFVIGGASIDAGLVRRRGRRECVGSHQEQSRDACFGQVLDAFTVAGPAAHGDAVLG